MSERLVITRFCKGLRKVLGRFSEGSREVLTKTTSSANGSARITFFISFDVLLIASNVRFFDTSLKEGRRFPPPWTPLVWMSVLLLTASCEPAEPGQATVTTRAQITYKIGTPTMTTRGENPTISSRVK